MCWENTVWNVDGDERTVSTGSALYRDAVVVGWGRNTLRQSSGVNVIFCQKVNFRLLKKWVHAQENARLYKKIKIALNT